MKIRSCRQFSSFEKVLKGASLIYTVAIAAISAHGLVSAIQLGNTVLLVGPIASLSIIVPLMVVFWNIP